MKDTFWTDELVKEYASLYIKESWEQLGELKKNITSIEQFKSSKAPKKEWEIVAFRHRGEIAALIEDWKEVRCYSQPHFEYPGQQMSLAWALDPANNCIIHSVRRLSDGEIFSVGDRLQGYASPITEITTKYWVDGIGFNCGEYGSGCSLSRAKKLPAPVLTTVDGKEMQENEECWIVDKHYKLLPDSEKINEFKRDFYSNCLIFSTREAAENYILNKRPLLSLNDVKEAAGVSYDDHVYTSVLFEKLTALVKQKLNP